MKCPHCGQEHSDNTNFCPETGKKIEVSQDRAGELIACTNPSCSDFGKRILPSDSKFCPTCGASLKKCSDVVSILLSLHDVTLGETNIYDIDAEEYVKSDSPMLRNEKAISINNYTKYGGSVSFVARSSDKKVFTCLINSLSNFGFPSSWVEIGVEPNNLMLSLEKLLGRESFEWEEAVTEDGRFVFSSKQIGSDKYIVLIIGEDLLGVSLVTEDMKERTYHELFINTNHGMEEDCDEEDDPNPSRDESIILSEQMVELFFVPPLKRENGIDSHPLLWHLAETESILYFDMDTAFIVCPDEGIEAPCTQWAVNEDDGSMALDSEAEDGYMSMDYAYVVSMLGQIIMKKYGVAKFCKILKLIN